LTVMTSCGSSCHKSVIISIINQSQLILKCTFSHKATEFYIQTSCSKIYTTRSQCNLLLSLLIMSQHVLATGGHLLVFNAKPDTLHLFMLWSYFLVESKISFHIQNYIKYKIVKMLKNVIIPRIGRCHSLSNKIMQHLLFVCRFVAMCCLFVCLFFFAYGCSVYVVCSVHVYNCVGQTGRTFNTSYKERHKR
jgi:hypothetical protein